MAEADAFPGLQRDLSWRPVSGELIDPDILCWVIHCISNEPCEETRVRWCQDASFWPSAPSRCRKLP